MFLIIASSITVIGILILIIIIAFYTDKVINKSNNHNKNTKRGVFIVEKEETPRNVSGEDVHYQNGDTRLEKDYLPVLDIKIPVKELEKELVHFHGDAIFFQIDTEKEISEIEINELKHKEKSKDTKCKVYLTSKWLVIINEHMKKIALKSIDDYKFIENIFLVKRKRVKKKKDVFKIVDNPVEFYYITKVLLKK